MNVIAQLEFELTFFQYFIHYTTETPFDCVLQIKYFNMCLACIYAISTKAQGLGGGGGGVVMNGYKEMSFFFLTACRKKAKMNFFTVSLRSPDDYPIDKS